MIWDSSYNDSLLQIHDEVPKRKRTEDTDWIQITKLFVQQNPQCHHEVTSKQVKERISYLLRCNIQQNLTVQETSKLDEVSCCDVNGDPEIAVPRLTEKSITPSIEEILAVQLDSGRGKSFSVKEKEIFDKLLRNPNVHANNKLDNSINWRIFMRKWEYETKLCKLQSNMTSEELLSNYKQGRRL